MKPINSIGFIGAGNMATALIKGLINSGIYSPEQINAFDADIEKIQKISNLHGIRGVSSNIELVKNSDIILLAVKPQVMEDVLNEIKGAVTDSHLVISIAAGIKIKKIKDFLGGNIPVIRVMPNTPALIQKGMSALAFSHDSTPDQMALADKIFDSVGRSVRVEEKVIDAVTALSGSGPGFIFRIMECFAEAAEMQGFDKKDAVMLTVQTFLGSASLAAESELNLSQLREMVTSPGGTTQAGLAFLDKSGISDIIKGAVEAARKRSVELGKN